MDVNTALQEMLKTALINDGLARGIREAAKALDKRQALVCVLASNCDEPVYVKLVEALCAEHQINLIKVDDKKKLEEWINCGFSFCITCNTSFEDVRGGKEEPVDPVEVEYSTQRPLDRCPQGSASLGANGELSLDR
nr:unnamed protein product [Rangifer tarandus platyrhynchus]